MGLTITIARGGLLQRPGRTLFSILGIGLGIATVVGVITLDHTTIGGISGIYAAAGNPDLEIRAPQNSDEPVELTDIEGLTDTSAFFRSDAMARTSTQVEEDERGMRVRLFAVESETFLALDLHRLLDGRELSPENAEREVLLGAALAGELGLAVGDEIELSRPRRVARKECVEGELRAVGQAAPDRPQTFLFEVVGILAREKLGRRARGMVAFVDYDWGAVLYEDAHVETRYWAKRDPAVDIERLQTSLGASYSYELDKSVLIGQAADERAFRTGVRMAGLLALVLGLYVIFHTLSMSLTERMNEVGTLHAIGVTRAQVARIFLFEAVALAGCGALVGLGGGIGLAWVLLSQGITTLGVGKYVQVFLIPWNIVLPLTVVGFLIALVGSVYPLSRLGGANTVAALRGEAALQASGVRRGFHLFFALLLAIVLPGLYVVLVPVVGEFAGPLVTILLSAVGFLALLVVLPLAMPSILTGVCSALAHPFTTLWPLSGRLATRAMQDSATRIAVSASAIALVSAGLVGLKGLTRSLRGEVEVWASEAAQDKVWVKDLPEVPYGEFSRHLAQFPGVLGIEKGNARTYGSFLLFGVDVSGLARYGPFAEDPSLIRRMQRGHGMVLSRRVAEERKYELGDFVYVTKADGSGQDFEVIAISDSYGYFPQPDERMYGVIADTYMKRYFCLDIDTVTDVAVRLAPGTDPGVVEAAILDFKFVPEGGANGEPAVDMSTVRYETGAALLAHHVMDIDRDFVLFDVLVALTAALAALGVLNGQLLAALERSKEIGILKALGVSGRQVGGMVLLESLVVGVVGGGIGVLLGTLMTPLIVGSLQELAGLTLPERGPGVWIAVALAGATLLTLIAGLYPIWRMNRFDAVRAVRTG